MKECPICGSRCFDDMDRCYGCLHDFTRDETGAVESRADGSGAGSGEEAHALRRSASRLVSHAPSDPGSLEGDVRPERAVPALSSLNLGSASGELSFVVRISLSPMAS